MTSEHSATARTKIAVLIGTLEVGGAELDIVRNFPRLNREEFDVVVVTFGEAGPLAPELERQGIPVISRPVWAPRTKASGADEGQPQATGQVAAVEEYQTPGWYAHYERFVLSLPVSWRKAVQPAKRAVGRAVAWATMRVRTRPRLRVGGRVPLGGLASARYIFGVTKWIRRTLIEEQVDIVHSFLPHSYAYAMAAGWFVWPHPRQVMSRLSLNFYKDSHPVLAWLERTVLHHRVDIAIGNSQLILDELAEEGVAAAKLRLLHNGIDPQPFVRGESARESAREAFGIAPEAFTIVAVGNLHTYKGHRDLIEACAGVSARLPEGWRLLIAGRDEAGNRAAYEALITELGLAEQIALLGPCDNVPRLLHAADVFVQPSHHEGLPNAIVEAMAALLPVIGTTVGGIPEVVRAVSGDSADAGATGWLVAPGDIEALGTALLHAADQPERRVRMGEAARARVVAEFSLSKSVGTYEAIYRELLPGRCHVDPEEHV